METCHGKKKTVGKRNGKCYKVGKNQRHSQWEIVLEKTQREKSESMEL